MGKTILTATGKQKRMIGYLYEVNGKYGNNLKLTLTEEDLKDLWACLTYDEKRNMNRVDCWIQKKRYRKKETYPTHDMSVTIEADHRLALRGDDLTQAQSKAKKRLDNAYAKGTQTVSKDPFKYEEKEDPFGGV